MPRDCDHILDLIQKTYQHTGSRKQWKLIMSGLQKIFRLHNLTILEVDVPERLSKTILHWDVEEKYLELYSERYAKINLSDRGGYILPMKSGNVKTDTDIDSFGEFRRLPIYKDFFEPQGSYHFLGAILGVSDNMFYLLSAQRTQKTGAYSPQDKRTMEAIIPHLGNRIDIEKRLALSRHDYRSLGTQRNPFVLLDHQLKVTFANKPAEKLLEQGDGISLTREGRLTASLPGCLAALRKSIEDAQAIHVGQGLCDPGLVKIKRPSGKQPYVLAIRPCCLDGLWTTDPTGVLVFINDPETMQGDLSAALMQTFGLTEAEAGVAFLLMRGLSPKHIAEVRGVSMPTIRSQIRSLMEKTYVSSQVEFVSLAFRTLGNTIV
jgi:DNA-binding CsgD family transcriptional regulator